MTDDGNGEKMLDEGAPLDVEADEIALNDDDEVSAALSELREPTDEEIAAMQEAIDKLPKYFAVLGAPGAGKSALAEAIATEYDMDLIDGYAKKLSTDLDIALGMYASYVPNLMVAMEREKLEHLNRMQMTDPETARSCITVGTLADSLAYAALSVEYQRLQITTPQQEMNIAKETLASQVIRIMLDDVMRFHLYFYLPLPAEIEVPGQEPKFDNFQRSLDNAIQQIIVSLGIPAVRITGSLESQMEQVAAAVEGL